ncbi:MFS transporter [Luteibacter sp. PPL554]
MALDRRRLLAYGLAHGGKSTFWYAGEWLFLYLLTEVWRIPPTQAAWTLALGMIVSGGLDLAVARAFSSRGLQPEAAADLQVMGAVACALAMVGLGALSGAASSQGAMAVAMILCFRVAYAFVDVPQNTLLPLLASDAHERVALTAARYVAGGLAALLIAGAGAQLPRSVASSGSGPLTACAIAMAAIAVVSAVILRHDIRSRAPGRVAPGSDNRPDHDDGLSFTALVSTMVVVSAGTALFGRLQLYLAAYGHGCAGLPLAVTAGMVAAQPLWLSLSRRYPLRRMLNASGWLTWMTSLMLAWVLADGASHGVRLVVGFVFGMPSAGLATGLWSLAASAATRRAARRDPSLTMAMFTCGSKLGLAGACLVTGWALQSATYRGGEITTLLGAMVGGSLVCAVACWRLTGRSVMIRRSGATAPQPARGRGMQ